MTDLQEAREFFSKDLFAVQGAGIEIDEVGERYSKCSMELKPIHQNAVGQVMGGAIFTLADFAFAVATNFHGPLTVTAVSQICYLGVARGNTLIAEAKLIKDGKRTCFYEISITDEIGTKVALVTSTGTHIS